MGRKNKNNNASKNSSGKAQANQANSINKQATATNTKHNEADPPTLYPASSKNSDSRLFIAAQQFSGPLPPPAILKEYENIQEGTMQQIIEMAVDAQKHSQVIDRKMLELEEHTIKAATFHSTLGLVLAFLTAVIAIGGGIYLISIDKTIAGFVPLIGAVGSLAASFIYQKVNKIKKDKQKRGEEKQLDLPGI